MDYWRLHYIMFSCAFITSSPPVGLRRVPQLNNELVDMQPLGLYELVLLGLGNT